MCGLFDVKPAKFGLLDQSITLSENFGEQKENWQGFDYSVVARMPFGLTVQGGAGMGRKLADGCEVLTVVAGDLEMLVQRGDHRGVGGD